MRTLLSLLFFSSALLALINKPVHTTVINVNEDEETVFIKPIPQAQVGMYGVVIKHFSDTHSIALSWVEITEATPQRLSGKLLPIHALEQSALPTGNWTTSIGDEVVMAYNYQRGLLIAPNASVYKKVTAYHRDRKWIHPDIFTAVLSSNGHPSPLIEDFQAVCRANNIGIVSFIFDQSNITVDCQSFKIIQNKSTSLKTDEIQLPFYTRVTNIEANWFGEGSDEMTEYSPYYIELLAEANPENTWIQEYKENRSAKTDEEHFEAD